MSMIDSTTPAARPLTAPIAALSHRLAQVPASLVLLGLRVAIAVPFFKSGLTKWDGFLTLSNGAQYLFTQEFKLHVFGQAFAYPAPLTMATLAGIGEIVLPILLVLGLGTRFAALGLLLMTAVIQLTVPEGWAIHLTWAAMALALIRYGGGGLSVDRVVGTDGPHVCTKGNPN